MFWVEVSNTLSGEFTTDDPPPYRYPPLFFSRILISKNFLLRISLRKNFLQMTPPSFFPKSSEGGGLSVVNSPDVLEMVKSGELKEN